MTHDEKFYLINIDYDFKINHKIVYEMPPFCSGDYETIIYKDEKGLFIKKSDNFFTGCRDFKIIPL